MPQELLPLSPKQGLLPRLLVLLQAGMHVPFLTSLLSHLNTLIANKGFSNGSFSLS